MCTKLLIVVTQSCVPCGIHTFMWYTFTTQSCVPCGIHHMAVVTRSGSIHTFMTQSCVVHTFYMTHVVFTTWQLWRGHVVFTHSWRSHGTHDCIMDVWIQIAHSCDPVTVEYIHESRLTNTYSWVTSFMSWIHIHDSRLHIHESRLHIHESRLHIHESRLHIHESRQRIHESRPHIHESCLTCICETHAGPRSQPRVNESCPFDESWHTHVNEPCHIRYLPMSHGTRTHVSCHTYICETPALPRSHSHVNESCPTNESWHTHEWVMAHLYSWNACSTTHTLPYGWVMSQYGTYTWVTVDTLTSHGTHIFVKRLPPPPCWHHQPLFANSHLLLHTQGVAVCYIHIIKQPYTWLKRALYTPQKRAHTSFVSCIGLFCVMHAALLRHV